MLGALCGGVLIDECFQQLCKNRLGRRWTHLSPNGIKEIMGDKWEKNYKREFFPKQSKEEYPVPIPAEAYKGGDKVSDDLSRLPYIKNGRIQFREQDLIEAFAESFARIDELVDEQISKAKQRGLTLQVSRQTHVYFLQTWPNSFTLGDYPRRWARFKPISSSASNREVLEGPTDRHKINGNEAVSQHNLDDGC